MIPVRVEQATGVGLDIDSTLEVKCVTFPCAKEWKSFTHMKVKGCTKIACDGSKDECTCYAK